MKKRMITLFLVLSAFIYMDYDLLLKKNVNNENTAKSITEQITEEDCAVIVDDIEIVNENSIQITTSQTLYLQENQNQIWKPPTNNFNL